MSGSTGAQVSFLARIGHELRTPLNAILGFSELLEGEHFGSLSNPQRTYLRHIHDSGELLLELVNDLLDLGRLQAGELRLARAATTPSSLTEAAMDRVRTIAGAKGVFLRRSHDSVRDQVWWLDAARVEQVLAHLLLNAIAATPPGGLVQLDSGTAPSGDAEFFVRDTGYGISPRDQERLLGATFETPPHGAAEACGPGRGLALVQRLVALHGGEVSVRTHPEGGTTVRVALPVGLEEEPAPSEVGGPRAALMNPLGGNLDLLQAPLEAAGFGVDIRSTSHREWWNALGEIPVDLVVVQRQPELSGSSMRIGNAGYDPRALLPGVLVIPELQARGDSFSLPMGFTLHWLRAHRLENLSAFLTRLCGGEAA